MYNFIVCNLLRQRYNGIYLPKIIVDERPFILHKKTKREISIRI